MPYLPTSVNLGAFQYEKHHGMSIKDKTKMHKISVHVIGVSPLNQHRYSRWENS